nr:hypothetical protein C1892_06895 [Pseudomonas sp. MPBD7-1]
MVVQVLGTGVCRSNWHGWKGHDPDIQLPHVPRSESTPTVCPPAYHFAENQYRASFTWVLRPT